MEFSQDNHSLSSAESSVTQESLKRKSDTSVMSGQEAPTKKLKLTNDSSQASEVCSITFSAPFPNTDRDVKRDISSQSTIAGDHFSATRGHEFSDGPSTPLGNPARASYSTQANPEIKGGGMFMVFSTDLTHSMTSDCISPISRSSTPAPTSIQRRRKVGRPRTKALLTGPSTKRFKKSTVLRVNRPVEARLPMDIWDRIFEFSKPEALFKLRSVSPGFKEALSKEGVWKDSLFQEFGPSLPDPPQDLSYMHYANLLTSHGCQACNNLCGGKARRTYWAFQRRYCEICLVDKIVFVSALELVANKHSY